MRVSSTFVYAVEDVFTFLLKVAAAENKIQRMFHETLQMSSPENLMEVLAIEPPGQSHRFEAMQGPLEVRDEAEVELLR